MEDSPGLEFHPATRAVLDATFAGTSEGIAVFDTTSRLVEFNDAFWRFCRFPSRDDCLRAIADFDRYLIVETPTGTVLPPDRWVVPRALQGEPQRGVPYRLGRRGSSDVWWGLFAATPIRRGDGTIIGAVMTVQDTSEQQRLVDELRQSQMELRELIAERERLQEEERKRISRELHDGLQQVLTALNMKIGMAEDAVTSDPAAAVRWLDEAQDSVIDTSQAIRDMIRALRPQGLNDRSLHEALDSLVRLQAGVGHITCTFRASADTGPEPAPEVGDCLYRVAQEALNNVIKHASATRADVVLHDGPDGTLCLHIADNGRGFDDADLRTGGLGLVGMRERVAAAGGTLQVTGTPGEGTTVEARVPRHRDAKERST